MWFSVNRGMRQTSTDGPARSWIKSSFSMANSNCVEVRGLRGDLIEVRNSRKPKGAVLGFTPAEWDAFVSGVRNGEFDRQ